MFSAMICRDLHPFDLLVFDEASQVPLVHFLALTPLANRVLVGGDPQQLAPIVRSEGPSAKKWIGNSAFFYRSSAGDATVTLDEQSRMSE